MRSVLLAAVLLAAGCADPAPVTPGRAGERPTVAAPDTLDTSRIVTLGGPATEIVHALGLGDRVVGTDRSSLYPASILAGPRLDYWRQTSAEGVLALRPTLVVAMEGLGPPAVRGQLAAAGVPVVLVPEATSAEAAEARALDLGRRLGRADAARAVVQTMRDELAAARALRPATPPRALFVYARGAGVVLVAGADSPADAVLALAGATNAVDAFAGYRPLTAEAVAGAAPDVIVVPAGSLESLGGVDALLAQPGLAQTPAGRARRVVAVDDALLLGMGPRLGQGVAALARGLAR